MSPTAEPDDQRAATSASPKIQMAKNKRSGEELFADWREFECKEERFRLTQLGGALGSLLCLQDECRTSSERYQKLASLRSLILNDIDAILLRGMNHQPS